MLCFRAEAGPHPKPGEGIELDHKLASAGGPERRRSGPRGTVILNDISMRWLRTVQGPGSTLIHRSAPLPTRDTLWAMRHGRMIVGDAGPAAPSLRLAGLHPQGHTCSIVISMREPLAFWVVTPAGARSELSRTIPLSGWRKCIFYLARFDAARAAAPRASSIKRPM